MDTNPTCRLYYVTTGTWHENVGFRSRITQGKDDLDATDLFSHVEFQPMDSDAIRMAYRELHRKVVQKIKFENHTILPIINGVDEAYIGILPCLEYLNLICNERGELNRRLFYDNVRDFQGHNAVNQEIDTTIKNVDQSDRFVLLNNGVTIVARNANKTGANFALRDYQIVNGCQTSHIVHQNRDALTDNIFLPIKLIVTTNPEVTNQIIQGTNRQTEVKIEAFESLAPFQKKLEEFYLAIGRDRQPPIYYERRSKQYENMNVQRDRIISLATQVKCFVAMFLNEPQSTHRYYGELLNSYRGRVFAESHTPFPYYLSAVCLSAVERSFASGALSRDLRIFKYQILMVFRLTYEPFKVPFLDNKRRMDEYCQELLKIVEDDGARVRAFCRAEGVIRGCRSAVRGQERMKAFTTELIRSASGPAEGARARRLVGTVKRFSDTLGYGFVMGDDSREYFVHYTRLIGQGYRYLEERERVEFTPYRTDRGLQAVDVQRLNLGA